jgi:hypothetical protein
LNLFLTLSLVDFSLKLKQWDLKWVYVLFHLPVQFFLDSTVHNMFVLFRYGSQWFAIVPTVTIKWASDYLDINRLPSFEPVSNSEFGRFLLETKTMGLDMGIYSFSFTNKVLNGLSFRNTLCYLDDVWDWGWGLKNSNSLWKIYRSFLTILFSWIEAIVSREC